MIKNRCGYSSMDQHTDTARLCGNTRLVAETQLRDADRGPSPSVGMPGHLAPAGWSSPCSSCSARIKHPLLQVIADRAQQPAKCT